MIVVPLHVSWASMMIGKLHGALRPSRLVLLAFVVVSMGVGLSLQHGTSVWRTTGLVFAAVSAVRLALMAISSALDPWARRMSGALEVSESGLVHRAASGEPRALPWAWVLDARERREGFVLRVDERRGRAFVFVTKAKLEDGGDGLRALLRSCGKLASPG